MPAAVNINPNGTSARDKDRKAGVVRFAANEENHHSKASGAKTPTHSYQVQVDTKK
jgi:hypothetical protein